MSISDEDKHLPSAFLVLYPQQLTTIASLTVALVFEEKKNIVKKLLQVKQHWAISMIKDMIYSEK